MEIIGKLYEKHDTVQRTQTFSVREFVIEIENPRNPQYNDFVLFQLTNDRCPLIDPFAAGELLQITFDIRGRRWQSPEGRVSYFNTLNAWRVERYTPQAAVGAYQQPVQPAAAQ